MKIVYVTDQTFLHGGIEKVLSQKANYLAEVLGDEVTIVTYRQQNRHPIYPFSEKIAFADLGVNYDIAKSYFHPENVKKIPQHFSRLQKVLRTMKPDVVISCHFGPDFYFLPYLEQHTPKIKEFHSSRYFYRNNPTTFKEKLLHQLTQRAERRYDQLVVLNNSEKEYYTNKCIAVIPNPAEQTPLRANWGSEKIMAAGRISPVKNYGELIDAFARVASVFPSWQLHFFGEDYVRMRQKLENQVEKYGLQNQIKFKGSASDLKKEMQNYSIYAMTSETECFPMVLLEALSIGMPIVSYNSPTGPKHILTSPQDSFLVPYKNLDIFTNKLNQLMQSETLRQEMGQKGIQNVTRFQIEKVMRQWKNLFTTLINRQ